MIEEPQVRNCEMHFLNQRDEVGEDCSRTCLEEGATVADCFLPVATGLARNSVYIVDPALNIICALLLSVKI